MSVDVVVASSSEARDVRDGDLARFVEDEPWMNCEGVKLSKVEHCGPNA
jgi:hypothetical protein